MRKIAAHYIFPISAPPVRNGMLTLSDDGEILDISEMKEESAGVEFYSGILVPGFVNAHCHVELSHLVGRLPEHTGLAQFLLNVVANRGAFSDEEIYRAIALADAQMYAGGTVAVGDISNGEASFAAKKKSSIFYHTFIEILDLWKGNVDEQLRAAQALLDMAAGLKLSASLTAHAPYSTSAAVLRALAQHSAHVSIHNQESADENLFFTQGKGSLYDVYAKIATLPQATGKSSIHQTLENLAGVEKLLLVHNTYTTAEDYDFATACKQNISWVLCPRSNFFIEKSVPPVQLLRSKGASIALGTDSLSSNLSLQMLDELKFLSQHFPDISLNEMLMWATLGGAKALRKESVFGSFERGKKPGVVLLENLDMSKLVLTEKTTSRLLTKK